MDFHDLFQLLSFASHIGKLFERFFPLSDIMDLRHQSSAMCIIMFEEDTHTRGLQLT